MIEEKNSEKEVSKKEISLSEIDERVTNLEKSVVRIVQVLEVMDQRIKKLEMRRLIQ